MTIEKTRLNIEYSDRISKASSYPFAEIDKKVSDLKNKGVDVIDFGVGDPKSPTPAFVTNGLSEFAGIRKTSGYPSYIGSIEYREACAEHMLENFGVTLNPETEISSTVGSKESIFNFPMGFTNPGDIVICPTPGYPVYKTGTEFIGAKPYLAPLLEENNYLIDFEKIPEEIAKKAKIIWTNYPNSPTGAMAPLSWLKDFCAWAEKYNIIIAADEGCYIDLYFKEKPHSILEVKKEGIITFYSLSKRNNMTGYRVGFVAGDKNIISGFRKVKTNIDSGTPTFIQDVASIALLDKSHAEEMRKEYQEKRNILIPALKSLGLEETTSNSTFYIWQKSPKNMDDVEFALKLIDGGIVVTPGSMISDTADGVNPGKGFVRFALVPTKEEVQKAANIIKDLKL
ncbi:MAG: aminotransferase class I/II-fold pyridoxal phosphate-dependent enzyme [Alphaproteobacteria bacterium]|nr:aminotransferase class I/II-fold pyridoxal phosphate-dependent enzyme [Alphaproteobacteria bacterium]